MGVKVETSEQKNRLIVDYPHIGVTESGLIVLFALPRHGTVLYPGTSTWKIGQVHIDWDMSQFSPYVGEITLSNE